MGRVPRFSIGSGATSLPVLAKARVGVWAPVWLVLLLACLFHGAVSAAELQRFDGVQLELTDWADGDSFRVRFLDGSQHTLRLYAVDCLELHVSDRTDARRLRAQRRYFGITNYGGSVVESVTLAKSLGARATSRVRRLLQAPFTVHTSFADGGGDGNYKRIYGFVTMADGRDLAEVLVADGLARAYGVYRRTPSGLSRDESRARLKDIELQAAGRRRGAWAYTDWDALAEQRAEQRRDDSELAMAAGVAVLTGHMDINLAARDELMRLPGIGEHFANAIIEHRPYRSVDDLLRVPGIGRKRLAKLKRHVVVKLR